MKSLDFIKCVWITLLLLVLHPVANAVAQKYVIITNEASVYDKPTTSSTIRMNQFSENVSLARGKVFELVATQGFWYQIKGDFCGEGIEDGYVQIKNCTTDGEVLIGDINKKFPVNNYSDVRFTFSTVGNNTYEAKIIPIDAAATGLNTSYTGVSQGNILLFKEKVYNDEEELRYTVVKLGGKIYIYGYGILF